MWIVWILTTISSQATLVGLAGPLEISCLLLSTHGKRPESRLDSFINTIDAQSWSSAQLYRFFWEAPYSTTVSPPNFCCHQKTVLFLFFLFTTTASSWELFFQALPCQAVNWPVTSCKQGARFYHQSLHLVNFQPSEDLCSLVKLPGSGRKQRVCLVVIIY